MTASAPYSRLQYGKPRHRHGFRKEELMKQCPVCVKELPDDAVFCAYCGHDVKTGVAPVRKKSEDRKGAYMGGTVLIVLGVIFLISAYTRYDFGELWPVLLIAIGIGLILKR